MFSILHDLEHFPKVSAVIILPKQITLFYEVKICLEPRLSSDFSGIFRCEFGLQL